MVPVRVYHECRKVMRSVIGPKPGASVVSPSVFDGCPIKINDGGSVWRGEGQMKTWTGWALPTGQNLIANLSPPPWTP